VILLLTFYSETDYITADGCRRSKSMIFILNLIIIIIMMMI